MKIKSISFVALTVLAFNVQAYEGQITVHVADENGLAVSDAQTVVQLENILPPGEGWGSGRPTETNGLTDTNGNYVITGNSTGGSVSVAVRKDGYYYGNGGTAFTNVILNRWQPWNPTVEVVLQKKGVQVPMYARRVRDIKIPAKDKPMGFDLTAGDWVAPYGKGTTADFVFQVEVKPTRWITNWYGTSPRPYPLQDNKMIVSFSDDGDGIQSAAPLPRGFRVARQAPSEGYKPVLEKTQYDETVGMVHQNTEIQHHTNLSKNENYFFRVRTKKDAQGNIVSALYGKIYGEFNNGGGIGDTVSFDYYLNPEPNSLDMEFDPSRNLFKKLSFMEKVSAP